MKFEGSGSKGTQVIERKQSVTDGQTDKAKTICLPPGDIIKKKCGLRYRFLLGVLYL